MCLMCEQEEMLAAYREFLARRAAKTTGTAEDGAAPAAGAAAPTPGTPDDDAWAAGTWFDVKIAPKE